MLGFKWKIYPNALNAKLGGQKQNAFDQVKSQKDSTRWLCDHCLKKHDMLTTTHGLLPDIPPEPSVHIIQSPSKWTPAATGLLECIKRTCHNVTCLYS